jgi:hypothetical protein
MVKMGEIVPCSFHNSQSLPALGPLPVATNRVSMLQEQYQRPFMWVPPRNLLYLFVPGVLIAMVSRKDMVSTKALSDVRLHEVLLSDYILCACLTRLPRR